MTVDSDGSASLSASGCDTSPPGTVAVLVCAKGEWNALRLIFAREPVNHSPFGEWFADASWGERVRLVYFFTGWGKTSAAAATQYVIDRWAPSLIVNAGTCGGLGSSARIGTIVIPAQTVIYDIEERMGDAAEAIRHYCVKLDTSWLVGTPLERHIRSVLVSGDRDVSPDMVGFLEAQYGTIAADWESGAITYVASRNGTMVLVVRVISDIVNSEAGEAYGNESLFRKRCEAIMRTIGELVPEIVGAFLQDSERRGRN